MARNNVLTSAVTAAVAIVVGLAAWSIYGHTEYEADSPLRRMASPTTTSAEAAQSGRALADQAVVINIDELGECNLVQKMTPNVDLPEWAHAARLIAGRWLVTEEAIALPFLDPERPQLSILWHLAAPPADPTDFTVVATTASEEVVEAIELRPTAPGFFRSTFPLDEEGCWSVSANWGEGETELRFLSDLYSAH